MWEAGVIKKYQELLLSFFSLMNTHNVFYETTGKGEMLLFILLFLDEKKQKSSDCT
jgi:hypothetical protein